jgi:hypothetical protein
MTEDRMMKGEGSNKTIKTFNWIIPRILVYPVKQNIAQEIPEFCFSSAKRITDIFFAEQKNIWNIKR